MKTIKSFAAQSNIPESLIRAVIKQIGGWQSFKESAPDVANYGAAGGVGGFIYHSETVKFTENNRPAMVALLKDQANAFGCESWFSLVARFNACDLSPEGVAEAFYDKESDEYIQIYNLLAWHALEEVARNYCDLIDN